MILGYARVSTDDQLLDAQQDALTAAGAERIFSDKISGSSRLRPELDRMIEQLREGDVVVVTKYDRLSRCGLPVPCRGHRHDNLGRAAGLPRFCLDRSV